MERVRASRPGQEPLPAVRLALALMKSVTLVTDGSCLGNPGPGGWAAILRCGRHKKELTGSAEHTTNNRMEMTAVAKGLRALREPCEVIVEIDSEYVKQGITGWIHSWKRRGWKTAGGSPVKNKDLWQELDEASARHRIRWVWVKGHASHDDNNRCDGLAKAAARQTKAWQRRAGRSRSEAQTDGAARRSARASLAKSPLIASWNPARQRRGRELAESNLDGQRSFARTSSDRRRSDMRRSTREIQVGGGLAAAEAAARATTVAARPRQEPELGGIGRQLSDARPNECGPPPVVV